MMRQLTFIDGLVASEPAPEYADKLMLYGQFVGDWITETVEYGPDSTQEHSQWDIRFAWVLEGRAIQDLWITPRRTPGEVPWHKPANRYSTTLRIYEPALDAWHIVWVNPPGGVILRQFAKQVGNTIVQSGPADPNGDLSRWVYRDIQADSFHWFNERSADGGDRWRVVQEMRARRIGT